jgi:hypothetical protein
MNHLLNSDSLQSLVARLWPIGTLLVAAGATHAGPVPANLGAGLGEIVSARLAARIPGSQLARQREVTAPAGQMLWLDTTSVLRDQNNRVLVDVLVSGQHKYDSVRSAFTALPGVSIIAEDRHYRAGILEGYVPEDALIALAKLPGVAAVHAVHRPPTSAGAITQQGVVQHRVNQLPANLDGTGITIGVISDSYNTSSNLIKAANDVASGDLPGAGNPFGNIQPVVVLEDWPVSGSTDEGRAMAQTIHDMAPKARLGFATANLGEVSFANNIRALAGVQGLPNSRLDFAAQIIVDDVQYFTEGMFTDGILAQAVDDVTALGVAYFSAAGNLPPTQAYASDFRWVPNGPNATAGTTVNLADVPPALYAGGFHNFRTDGTQDIAQTMTRGTNGGLGMTLQWDDPWDVTPLTVGSLVHESAGALTASIFEVDTTFTGVAGKQYQIDVRGDSTTGGVGNLDVRVTLIMPDGSTLMDVDTGTSETFSFFASQSGTYTVRVSGFGGDAGTFIVKVNEGSGVLPVSSDFNLLFFNATTGAYLGCVCENNLATNRPVEVAAGISFPFGAAGSQVQLVIARANMPTVPAPASRLRYRMIGARTAYGAPSEYVSYTTPVIYGHSVAAGANTVAAYSPFRPNIPEDYSSTGPARVVWDRNNNRIPDHLQVRLKPEMAAMAGGNVTFFGLDSVGDPDTFPNFFGTSAAASNAAAIAALVLQHKGGPGSVTPLQMRTILQRSAFPHDLDPYYSKAQSVATPNRGKVTVTLEGDNSTAARTDPNAFTIAYTGPSSITSIKFDGSDGNPGGGSYSVASSPGLVFDTRAAGQPFVVGSGSVGLGAANVTATLLSQAPPPSVAGHFFGLRLDFTPGTFTGGKALRFGIGRAIYRGLVYGSSPAANSGDLAGAVTLMPEGTIATGGVTYVGSLADGSTFNGTLTNRLGTGWSRLDGWGFINALSAINQPLP